MKGTECISHREPHVPEQAPHKRFTLPVTLKWPRTKSKETIPRNFCNLHKCVLVRKMAQSHSTVIICNNYGITEQWQQLSLTIKEKNMVGVMPKVWQLQCSKKINPGFPNPTREFCVPIMFYYFQESILNYLQGNHTNNLCLHSL